MKKLFIALILTLWMSSSVLAAGTVTQSMATFGADNKVVVTFLCTGDASDGSIPNTALATSTYNVVKGMYLYEVEAYPTLNGTAPDAADVFILDANDIDLLGSEDEGIIKAAFAQDYGETDETRGFAGDTSLTNYIWNYLGNGNPYAGTVNGMTLQ